MPLSSPPQSPCRALGSARFSQRDSRRSARCLRPLALLLPLDFAQSALTQQQPTVRRTVDSAVIPPIFCHAQVPPGLPQASSRLSRSSPSPERTVRNPADFDLTTCYDLESCPMKLSSGATLIISDGYTIHILWKYHSYKFFIYSSYFDCS